MVSHLTLVALLYYLRIHWQPNYHIVFTVGGWLRKDYGWCDRLTTDTFQYSLKLQVLI